MNPGFSPAGPRGFEREMIAAPEKFKLELTLSVNILFVILTKRVNIVAVRTEILFPIDEEPGEWNEMKRLVRRHNIQRAKLIRRRLDDLRAAASLETMRVLPGRCHELKGDRAGELSLDLDGPYRLILRPAGNPVPRKQDGGLDWKAITTMTVVGVVNTHE
jgi:plasmid maintenance system killer protein